MVAKLSGIGCSSKTPAYFLREAHGFNCVHGRMPALVAGANAANRDLIYIGISGDGDSLSIGLGQLCHAIRRNVNVLYVLENNGVYGLTKGQFSASADLGSLSKKGEANTMEAIDGCLLALTLGATFVARSFSGDKAQLVPILKAGLAHNGLRVRRRHLAVRDLQRSRGLDQELRLHARAERRGRAGRLRAAGRRDHDRVRRRARCATCMLHDGSWVRLRKVADDYDPTDRDRAYSYIRERQTGTARSSPACSTSRPTRATCTSRATRSRRRSSSSRTSSSARAAPSSRSCRRNSDSHVSKRDTIAGVQPRRARLMRQWQGFLTLAAPVAAFAVLVSGVHAQSAPTVGSGWKTLFDGKDLSQWRGYKSESVPEGWKVVDGTLWKNTQPADLVSKERVRRLRALDRMEDRARPATAASSIAAPRKTITSTGRRPEYQLLDDEKADDNKSRLTCAGAAYALYLSPPGHLKPVGQWNATRILAKGAHVEHWLNGTKLLEYELWSPDWEAKVKASKFGVHPSYGRAKKGHFALQGDDEGELSFRNIKVRVME